MPHSNKHSDPARSSLLRAGGAQEENRRPEGGEEIRVIDRVADSVAIRALRKTYVFRTPQIELPFLNHRGARNPLCDKGSLIASSLCSHPPLPAVVGALRVPQMVKLKCQNPPGPQVRARILPRTAVVATFWGRRGDNFGHLGDGSPLSNLLLTCSGV